MYRWLLCELQYLVEGCISSVGSGRVNIPNVNHCVDKFLAGSQTEIPLRMSAAAHLAMTYGLLWVASCWLPLLSQFNNSHSRYQKY
jgi:hypothetical protein